MLVDSREPEREIPLTPVVFEVLLALRGGEQHGYGIMKEVKQRTGSKVRVGPGTIYGILDRMQVAGFIEESGERPDPVYDDKRRRYYRLTDYGRKVAAAETARIVDLGRRASGKRGLLREPDIAPEGI